MLVVLQKIVEFNDFSRLLSDFPVLFKADLIFKDFSRKPSKFKYFFKPVRTLYLPLWTGVLMGNLDQHSNQETPMSTESLHDTKSLRENGVKMVKSNILLRRKHLNPAEFVIIIHKNRKGKLREYILAHRIGISEILPCDRKSYLTHAILPRLSREGYIHWLYWNSRTLSSSDVIVMLK